MVTDVSSSQVTEPRSRNRTTQASQENVARSYPHGSGENGVTLRGAQLPAPGTVLQEDSSRRKRMWGAVPANDHPDGEGQVRLWERSAVVDIDNILARLSEHGLLLQQDKRLASVIGVIVGGPLA